MIFLPCLFVFRNGAFVFVSRIGGTVSRHVGTVSAFTVAVPVTLVIINCHVGTVSDHVENSSDITVAKPVTSVNNNHGRGNCSASTVAVPEAIIFNHQNCVFATSGKDFLCL